MSSILLDNKTQQSLWKHLRKDSVVRLVSTQQYKDRKLILKEIENEISSGCYSPKPIHGFLSTPKGNEVPRFVPVLSFHDIVVYFGCVKAFDEKLASSAVEDTFGGWSLGGKRRDIEENRAITIFTENLDTSMSIPISTYDQWAWVDNWQQFWKLLAANFKNAPANSYFAMFDIANFYDSIDLPRLERELRRTCPDEDLAIEVIFYLLSTWNKGINKYARTTKGIPMDIVGDCSRVLANFFLTPFDRQMRDESQQRSSHFMRFADDMVLVCPDLNTCKELIYFASNQLHNIGLNINVAKVNFFSKENFDKWWGFEILADLEADSIKDGIKKLKSSWNDKFYGRRETALKRAITKLAKLPKHVSLKRWAYHTAISSDHFVLQLNDAQQRNLINISMDIQCAITAIATIILKSPFSQPKACLLRCMESFHNHKDSETNSTVRSIIAEISNISDPILNLAIQNMPVMKSKST